MNKWLAMVVCLSTGVAFGQTSTEQSLEQQINDLKKTVEAQQKALQEQQATLHKLESSSITPKKEEAKGIAFKMDDAYGSIALKGDIRFRYEGQRFENDTKDRDRLRTRLRLGAVWQSKNKDWEIGVGVASGKGSTSTNVTWAESGENSNFGGMSIDIDYAYARNYFDSSWGMNILTIGQMKSPFISADILWDSDITPIGISYGWKKGDLFFNGGAFELRDDGRTDLTYKSWLFGAQFGIDKNAKGKDKLGYKAAIGYYGLNNKNDSLLTAASLESDFRFQIVQAYGELNYDLGNKRKVGIYGDLWYNLGAAGDVASTEFNNGNADGRNALGLVVGVKGSIGKLSADLAYVYCGAFSAYWPLTDSDFGNGVNYKGNGCAADVQGLRLKAAYKFNKNISLNGTYLYYQRINDTGVANSYGHTVQIDLSYKF